jgi:hypothetical protein
MSSSYQKLGDIKAISHHACCMWKFLVVWNLVKWALLPSRTRLLITQVEMSCNWDGRPISSHDSPSTTGTTNYTTACFKTFRDPELNLHHAVCFDENSWIGSRLTPCSHQIFLEEWKFGSTNRDSLILYNRIKFSLRGGDNLKLWFVSDQNRRDGDKLGSTHRHLFMFCGRIVIFLECRLGSTENCDSFTLITGSNFPGGVLGMTEDTLILI